MIKGKNLSVASAHMEVHKHRHHNNIVGLETSIDGEGSTKAEAGQSFFVFEKKQKTLPPSYILHNTVSTNKS